MGQVRRIATGTAALSVLPATRHDILTLAREMRASDRAETAELARASGRLTASWSVAGDLLHAFGRSDMWAVWTSGKLVGIGGIAPLPQNNAIGTVWFLGTDLADTHILALTLVMRRFIRANSHNWFAIGNVLPQDMGPRRRWLEKLGFDFADEEAQQNSNRLVTFWHHPAIGTEDQSRGTR